MLSLALNLLTIYSGSSPNPESTTATATPDPSPSPPASLASSHNPLPTEGGSESTLPTTAADHPNSINTHPIPSSSTYPTRNDNQEANSTEHTPALPSLYITFFIPFAPQSKDVVDNEIRLFNPSEDVRRRLRVVLLGGVGDNADFQMELREGRWEMRRVAVTEATQTQEREGQAKMEEAKVPRDIVLDEVTRRRADWHGQVQRLLAAMPTTLASLRNTHTHGAEDSSEGSSSDADTIVGFRARPTLFVTDVSRFTKSNLSFHLHPYHRERNHSSLTLIIILISSS